MTDSQLHCISYPGQGHDQTNIFAFAFVFRWDFTKINDIPININRGDCKYSTVNTIILSLHDPQFIAKGLENVEV
jgi:hypothetical protein